MLVDLDEVARIAAIAAEFEWTWSAGDPERLAAATGVPVTGLIVASGLYPSGDGAGAEPRVEYLTTVVAQGAGMPGDPEREFAELADRIASLLGPATRRRGGPRTEIGWEMPDVVIVVRRDERSIALDLVDPRYQVQVDSRSADDLERSVRPADWERFTVALRTTLGQLFDGSSFILSTGDDRLVQFMMHPAGLWSHVASDRFHDDGFPTSADAGTLIELGWVAPSQFHVWSYSTADPGDHPGLADRVTRTLREVLRVGAPTDLWIRALLRDRHARLDLGEFLTP